MAIPARAEREQLCDLFVALGPDAPTLCGDWTTRDLAAHLVVRERRPDAALGIIAGPLSSYGEHVRRRQAARDYALLVERVRTGPPLLSPMRLVDRQVNTIEYFVHHEDVRRGTAGWEPRRLDADLTADLTKLFPRAARLLARKAPAGLVMVPDRGEPVAVHRAKDGEATVTVSGPIGELVLFVYGRQGNSVVDLAGDAVAIEAMRTAAFGI